MEPSWEDAVRRGDVDAVRECLARGADLNARDRYGQTGLMLAAHGGCLAVVETLLAHGANTDVTAKYGLSALMLSIVAGHADIARLLARAGADRTLRGSGAPGFANKTAYDLALERGMHELLNELEPQDASGDAPGRLHVLDTLRGIALAGMFLVHFNIYAADESPGSALSDLYGSAVTLLFEERFWAMFGILFGVGFAVQLRRAEARGAPFITIYLRRLAALAGFGFVAHAFFGFNVLLGYALWGVPLLLVRNWSLRRLAIAALISAASWSLFDIVQAGYRVAAVGEAGYQAERAARAERNRAFLEENRAAQEAAHYPAVFRARLRHMSWFYVQPFSFLPVNTFTLFLLGVIGLRAGVFDDPAGHQRVIAWLMALGAASWAASHWLLPVELGERGGAIVSQVALGRLAGGFGVIREMWLAFVYIGAVLLLAARTPRSLQWLAPFAWTGRMALTNYMLQIALLDLAFSNYAMCLAPTRLQALAAALALFAANAVLSRWWLTRFRFGPLEWLWRSLTYGRPQPWAAATRRRAHA